MNMQTVGMENLPNIYIENINVLEKSRGFEIRVTVSMYDNESNPSWRGRVDNLKLKCSMISNSRIQELNGGEISLYEVGDSERFTRLELCDNLTISHLEDGYRKYKKTFEFSVVNPENLNVYAACFVDGLNFGIDLFDKFYGPMAGEKIFVGGQINDDSGYFYYPDTNEEYGGPVHSHNQGYMEGSEHTDGSHSRLAYVPEENFKITKSLLVGSQIAPSRSGVTNASVSDSITPSPTIQEERSPDLPGGY